MKGFELERIDTTKKVTDVINESYLPCSVKRDILRDIANVLDGLVVQQIKNDKIEYDKEKKEGKENG